MRMKRNRLLGILFLLSCVLLYIASRNSTKSTDIGIGIDIKRLFNVQKPSWVNYKIVENHENKEIDLDYSVDLNELRKRDGVGLDIKRSDHVFDDEIEVNKKHNNADDDDEYSDDLNDLSKKDNDKKAVKKQSNEHEEEIDVNTMETFRHQLHNTPTIPPPDENLYDARATKYKEDYRVERATETNYPANDFDILDKIGFILGDLKPKSDQKLLPTCSAPRQNFVYIKNHKCASDTLAAMFRRFGYVRNLTFVQPVRLFWNIGWPYLLKSHMYRALKTKQFNILTEHTVYDPYRLSKLMPPDSAYITSIREPFSRFQSAFPFFNYGFYSGILEMVDESVDPMEFFLLSNKTYFDEMYKHSVRSKVCVPQGLSTIRNFMSFELGLPVGYYSPEDRQNDLDYITNWLQHIDDKFDMVIIVEYFSESLVMLKRMMCWSAKDILFRRLNTKRLRPRPPPFAPSVVNSFLSWTFVDSLLYTHFNNTLWRRINAMGAEDFLAEVANFNHMRQVTIRFCEYILTNNDTNTEKLFRFLLDQSGPASKDYVIVNQSGVGNRLMFLRSKWNPEITITVDDCEQMFSELGLRDEIRKRYDDDPTPVEQPLPPGGGRPLGC